MVLISTLYQTGSPRSHKRFWLLSTYSLHLPGKEQRRLQSVRPVWTTVVGWTGGVIWAVASGEEAVAWGLAGVAVADCAWLWLAWLDAWVLSSAVTVFMLFSTELSPPATTSKPREANPASFKNLRRESCSDVSASRFSGWLNALVTVPLIKSQWRAIFQINNTSVTKDEATCTMRQVS